MAEAQKGIDVIWLFRLIEDEGTENAFKIAFQTEGELTETRDADSLATKDGAIRIPGALETEGTMTAIYSKNDPNDKKLRQALRKGAKVGFWEIDSSEQGEGENSGKYAATYYEGYVTERSKSFGAEDASEVEYTYSMEGEGQDGFATLSEEIERVVQYVFKDTTPVTGVPVG